MDKYHKIKNIKFLDDDIKITIDGKDFSFRLSDISIKLKNAVKSERENFKISPSGYGIHWPSIDEDLSIDGLLGIIHKPKMTKNKVASK